MEFPGRIPGTRAGPRRQRLSQPFGHAVAVARHRRLCVSAQDRTDVRLRQPAGIDPDALAAGTDVPVLQPPRAAAIRPRALPHRYIEMRRLDRDEIDAARRVDAVPPLIKGYLRLGGFVGDGAVIDPQFNTTDVAVVVQTDLVTEKYYKHYERQSRETPD